MAGYKRYRKDSPVSYALGITLTMELLQFRTEAVTRVFVHSEMKQGDTLEKLRGLCAKAHIEMLQTDKIFNVLSQKENCYVIGEFKKFPCSLDANCSHIVLVNPSNAGNMGTIMRSALGFGLQQMAIIRPAVDAFDPKVVRASMGAIFSTEFQYFDEFKEYYEQYGDREIYPFMLNAKKSLYDVSPKGKFSLVFGNEATGLPEEFSEIGTSVIIPHSSHIDSLNLPIAAGIAMYETTKGKFEV
ncbi:MAG: TrmH family RNA methyltransferase [Lachnospiraceae bacterium]|nr:TrmH family RNA methyltransferase [Lachnospiraceae bacterium]